MSGDDVKRWNVDHYPNLTEMVNGDFVLAFDHDRIVAELKRREMDAINKHIESSQNTLNALKELATARRELDAAKDQIAQLTRPRNFIGKTYELTQANFNQVCNELDLAREKLAETRERAERLGKELGLAVEQAAKQQRVIRKLKDQRNDLIDDYVRVSEFNSSRFFQAQEITIKTKEFDLEIEEIIERGETK
jgi:chromosome segregation ATPase